MIPNNKAIRILYDSMLVGILTTTNREVAVFEYDQDWLTNGFSISPFELPLESGFINAKENPFYGLFGVFNDSLPDGWGQLLVDRWLRQQGINPTGISWLDRLSIVGNHGMGALRYEPVVSYASQMPVQSLDFYANEVTKIVQEVEVESLDYWIERAGSPGGARPKILYDADGIEWLVKFPSESDPKDIGKLEYEYSLAAKKAGIIMPETRLFENKYFGSARFDRKNGKRLHMLTISGLLNASHRYPSLDYTDIMKAVLWVTESMVEVEKVFRQMVFNVLCHNQDDHAKNFSLLYESDKWIYSPAYDLVYSTGFRGNHSTTILNEGNPNKSQMIEAGVHAGLKVGLCEQIYLEVEEATFELVAYVNKRFR